MRLKKISALSLAAAISVCTVPAFGAAETENVNVPKYIFLFIGDGMSYPQVQTTNYYLNAIADDGDDVLTSESKLNMMKFPVAGSAQTYDSTSFCPDSASTATSISTGHKTYSGTINMDEKMETSYETIAEKLKKQLGYKVGILSSVNLNHATRQHFMRISHPEIIIMKLVRSLLQVILIILQVVVLRKQQDLIRIRRIFISWQKRLDTR